MQMETLAVKNDVKATDFFVRDKADQKPLDQIGVALLTGGCDPHYMFGLATGLIPQGVCVDVVGSSEMDTPEIRNTPGLNFLNFRGDQNPNASILTKVSRILRYYARLFRYAGRSKAEIFHILWNNKFQFFDRTLLMLYYKMRGKKITLTAHNVNDGRRDQCDSWFNRLTLRIQYHLVDHIFVHTQKMKKELIQDFGVREKAVTVIPFGINNAVPHTSLTCAEAKQRLGIGKDEKVILFFGNIRPYKGLEYLVAAFQRLVADHADYRLIIAGRLFKGAESYWAEIQQTIQNLPVPGRIIVKSEFIQDEETELYFKASDVLALPYTEIFQSGILLLGYSFGLPVVATDVGSFREDIIEGTTGFVCNPCDPADMADAFETYFQSELFKNLNNSRREIRSYAEERYSWQTIAGLTRNVYAALKGELPCGSLNLLSNRPSDP